MSNPYNGSKLGKRGGKWRASRKEYEEPRHGQSKTAAVVEAAKVYNDHYSFQETVETHLIPRVSLTKKLHLNMFPQDVEAEVTTVKHQQYDKTLGRMVETTHEHKRVTWKSDKNLLDTRKNDVFGEGTGTRFKRITSRSKRLTTENEIKTNLDNKVSLGNLATELDNEIETTELS